MNCFLLLSNSALYVLFSLWSYLELWMPVTSTRDIQTINSRVVVLQKIHSSPTRMCGSHIFQPETLNDGWSIIVKELRVKVCSARRRKKNILNDASSQSRWSVPKKKKINRWNLMSIFNFYASNFVFIFLLRPRKPILPGVSFINQMLSKTIVP